MKNKKKIDRYFRLTEISENIQVYSVKKKNAINLPGVKVKNKRNYQVELSSPYNDIKFIRRVRLTKLRQRRGKRFWLLFGLIQVGTSFQPTCINRPM